jgi:nuclear pore complex protein Nup210
MQFTQNFLDPDAVAIIVQVAQVRVAAAAESSIQTAYLSVNDKVELDVKYADELGRSINQYEVLTYILTY